MPAIIRFLGYDPLPEPTTLGARMRAFRMRSGLSVRDAAGRLGVDEGTWGHWERTGLVPWTRHQTLLDELLHQQNETAAHADPADIVR